MFKYTRESISLIIEDFKKYCKIFKCGSLIFTTLYFIYAIFNNVGIMAVNIVLAGMFLLYTIFEFATRHTNFKLTRKYTKRTYHWIKLSIKAFTLGSLLYSIYTATTHVSAITTIIATLMIIMWVLQLLLEIIIEIIENKAELLIESFNQDVEDLKKPVTFVSNTFKRLKGEEIEQKQKSKKIQMLEERINEKKEKKKSEKEAK